ncbi:polycystin family receptor for egg jelly [Penaeus vannamei]|uniref:polycystin family receptor for egg jelly n=1 Tax=Penaeus vannamei TaxID=6689 RepID=UPI00387F63F6
MLVDEDYVGWYRVLYVDGYGVKLITWGMLVEVELVVPTFRFIDTAASNFPTNASVRIDWGDGTLLETLLFQDPGDQQPLLTHVYAADGIYNVTAYIYNVVSGFEVYCTVTIVEEIIDFAIINKYYPTLTSLVGSAGFGSMKNQYPMDKNLTFAPTMTQGTVDYYTVEFTVNASTILTFNVIDPFQPLANEFHYHFDFETFLNLTVYAVNMFQSVPVDLFVEIVGQVRVGIIDDFAIVTGKNETKTFEVSFESLGGGTCLVIDFGDSSPLVAYGEEITCKTNFSHAFYYPEPTLDIINNYTHVYAAEGVYNMSIFAYNPISVTTDTLMFCVTSIKCRPPKVEIFGGTLDYLSAPKLYRGEVNSLAALGQVDCEVTSKTKKRWQIYHVDATTGATMQPVIIMNIITSWNKPEISIPKIFLTYGYYVLTYSLTMWDPAVLDPAWPFQKQADTYIEIVKTPIIAMMFEAALTRVVRGLIQTVDLEPGLHSIDPDFPDEKNFTVVWRCRVAGEAWPADDTIPKPIWTKGTGGGCFGNGPGLLDHTETTLSLLGSDFMTHGQTYEFEAIVKKDTRSTVALGQVVVVDGVPPIMKVQCIDPSLCIPDGDGVYVNPSFRIGLISECVDYCDGDVSYLWAAADGNDVTFPADPAHFPLGATANELAFSTQFFNDNPNLQDLRISLDATDNSQPSTGGGAYFMKVNQRPVGGTCSVAKPPLERALIDTYTLTCQGWVDPENKGIKSYNVWLVDDTGKRIPLTEATWSPVVPQDISLIMPPGTFTVEVEVVDKWGAFTLVKPEIDMTVNMPTKEELEAADVDKLIADLSGGGNTDMLIMALAAQTEVLKQAEWLSLSEENLATMTDEEKEELLIYLAEKNNAALDALKENVNFNSLSNINAAASTLSGILKGASINQEAVKTIDLDAKEKIVGLTEDMMEGLEDIEVAVPELLIPLANYMSNIVGGLSLSVGEAGSECENAPPNDVKKSDKLPFNTEVTGIDMVIPEDPLTIRKCNVRDVTNDRAPEMIKSILQSMDTVTEKILRKSVLGEVIEMETEMDVFLKMGIVRTPLKAIPIGKQGGGFFFPDMFCPQVNCSDPISYNARQWPFTTFAYPPSARNLAPGTKILDVKLYQRDLSNITVAGYTKRQIEVKIPRIAGKFGNDTLPEFELINATYESRQQLIPIMYSNFNITKNDSSVNIEVVLPNANPRMFIMVYQPRLPTLTNYSRFTFIKDLPVVNGTYDWFFTSADLNGTGRYFVGIGEFKPGFDLSKMNDPVKNNVGVKDLVNVSMNYYLRVFTSGCYFFEDQQEEWKGQGMSVTLSNHKMTICNSTHLTSFGSGMFVMPNTIDFNYVFVNMGFTDNLTIYLTLIVSLLIFVLLMIYARYKDKQDVTKLGATPLPDNDLEDKYLYEMLVFTGNKKSAQTDSVVQFIVSGEEDETDVRTLGDAKRKILRKDGVDVFVMAVPRPLGNLEYMRIWHDNSGRGPNASWYMSYIVFRDVQTGMKYEFVANKWFAVEHDDGQIDRLIAVAGKEQITEFKHLFNTTKNKNIADGHLWFSVFLRPPRSRFTRCQRVGSCFALLFLSMLANAMWYDVVPEQTGTGGLQLGPFSLSPEQIGVGIMANLVVFPPSILIVFIFRRSPPKKLRKNRINEAVKKSKKASEPTPDRPDSARSNVSLVEAEEQVAREGEEGDGEEGREEEEDEVQTKQKKRKKFTLPWWCVYIGWLLVLACIAASCFFLLMYGIMFGNSKATKWLTTLVVSFFSSVLLVQPLKIFLIAMLISVICKSRDLDEEDSEEDEEDPEICSDEEWLHRAPTRNKKLKQKKIDRETLDRLKKAREKEIEMWDIIKEIFSYSIFLWIFLTLSYGNRDPNAFYMQKTLREAFIHEGAVDGTDFSKVSNTNMFWYYLNNGLMTDLRADTLYNGKPPYSLRGFLNDWCNRIMGYAIIRQIRARKNSCRVPSAMKSLTTNCSGFGGLVNEDNEHYCAGWELPTERTKNSKACRKGEFRYSSAWDLQSLPVWGNRDWYSGGGYVIHLRGPTDEVLQNFKFLESNKWIDASTRAVLIEFSSYNSQVNLFGTSIIMAEFTPGGGISPHFRFEGIRLLQHHDNFGFFIYACEAAFVLFVLYFTGREARLMYRMRMEYFKNYWSYAEIAIIFACYSAMAVYGLRYYATYKVLQVFHKTYGNGYVRLQYAASLDELYGYIVGFVVFVGTLKFIKLLRFNKRMGVLSATLKQCWDDLSGFLMAFFLCFFSFVAMFFLLLNKFMEGFYNFVTAVETCFSMMLGKFQFEEMKTASDLVPIMFFVFVLCNSWVLINLLLTLIIKAFQQVKYDMMKQPNEYEMVAFVWGRFSTYLGLGVPAQVTPALETTSTGRSPNDPHAGELGADDGTGNDKVKELPDKVDKFLDYLNDVYFAGSLDVTNKDALKSSFYQGKNNGRGFSATPNSAKPRSGVRFRSGVGGRTGGGGGGGEGDIGDLYDGPRAKN